MKTTNPIQPLHKIYIESRPIMRGWFVMALASLALATSALAQQTEVNKAPTTAHATQPSTASAPGKTGSVTFSGSLRARLENWDWFATSAAENEYTFGAALVRLNLSQQKDKFDWQIEGAFPLLLKLPETAIAPAPQGQIGLGASYFAANGKQDASAILKQAFIRFKELGGDKPSSLRIGRFEFVEGAETTPADATLATLKRDHLAHRLIGTFGFTHIGRSFDGVQYARNLKTSNFTLLAARPTEGVFQLRSLNELDVDFYYGAFTKSFAGKTTQSEARGFALHYHDGRRTLKADNRPLPARQTDTRNIRLTTVGGHYIGAMQVAGGTVDALLWGVGQYGSWGKLNHRAGALAFEAGYQFPVKIKTWLRGGYFRSSGDGNPGDDKHTTFFQVLPTPRIYARFPFYNLMNNEDWFTQLRMKPHARLALRADARYLRLSNEKDLWYLGGGAFQKGTFGFLARPSGGKKNLGTLFDVSADYHLASRTTLSFYVGGVRGSNVQANIYTEGGNHPVAHFLYFELTQRF